MTDIAPELIVAAQKAVIDTIDAFIDTSDFADDHEIRVISWTGSGPTHLDIESVETDEVLARVVALPVSATGLVGLHVAHIARDDGGADAFLAAPTEIDLYEQLVAWALAHRKELDAELPDDALEGPEPLTDARNREIVAEFFADLQKIGLTIGETR